MIMCTRAPAAIVKECEGILRVLFVPQIRKNKNTVTVEKVKHKFVLRRDVWVRDRSSESGSEETCIRHMINDIFARKVLCVNLLFPQPTAFVKNVLNVILSPSLSAETLLDDFMLTHPIFLASDKFQQVLLQQYPSHNVSISHVHLRSLSSKAWEKKNIEQGLKNAKDRLYCFFFLFSEDHCVQSRGIMCPGRATTGFVCLSRRIWNPVRTGRAH